MDWFLYDNGLRHERVNEIDAADPHCYFLWVEHDRLIVSFGQIVKLLQDFMYFSREGCLLRKIHTSEIC